jgi:excinuclease ABC subunit B
VDAKVILYADKVTESMQRAIDETTRRRALQEEYNREHNITPETVRKAIRAGIEADMEARAKANAAVGRTDETLYVTEEYIAELQTQMLAAADEMDFERAAVLRDRIKTMQSAIGKSVTEAEASAAKEPRGGRRGGGPKGRGKAGGRIPRPKRGAAG